MYKITTFDKEKLSVLSLHWGYSIGGVGKYASVIDGVKNYAPIEIKSICILSSFWQCDRETLRKLSAKEIIITSRFDISWLWRVSRAIDDIDPDLIFTHGFNGHFVALISRLFRKTKSVYICSYHGQYYAPSRNRKPFQPIFDIFTKYYIKNIACSTVSVSDYSRRCLVGKNSLQSSIEVIHNGIEDKVYVARESSSMLRREWGIKEDEILLGIASRLDPIKGIRYLIEALSQIDNAQHKLKLVIVGTGVLERELVDLAVELGVVDKVIFTGFRSDIDDCLAAFDIFVLPSLAENHSIALLEAMRAGKAIIVTDVGGNTESVRHNKDAIVIDSQNVSQLVDSVQRLANNDDLRKSLGESANRQFRERFAVKKMVQDTANWMIKCAPKNSDV